MRRLAIVTLLIFAGCGGSSESGGGGGTNSTARQVSFTVQGLNGSGLILTLNGEYSTQVNGNGVQNFATQLADGAVFQVEIQSTPREPAQECSILGGSGIIGTSSAVIVNCRDLPFETTTVSTFLADAVPLAVRARIARIASAAGHAAVGSSIAVASNSRTGERTLFALDRNGKPVLAAIGVGNSIELSAESTAVAMIRIAVGPAVSLSRATTLNTSIRRAPSFAALASEVQKSLDAGNMPAQAVAIPVLVSKVLSEIDTAPAASSTRMRIAGSIADQRVVDGSIVPDAVGPYGLFGVVARGSQPSLTISNRMPIPWVFDGTENGVSFSAVRVHPFGESPAVGGPQGFNIRAYQTDSTRVDMATEVVWRTVDTLLDWWGTPASCAEQQWKTILKEALASRRGLSVDLLLDGDWLVTQLEQLVAVATSCRPPGPWRDFANAIVDFVKPLKTLSAIVDASTTAALVAYSYSYWNYDQTRGVCGSTGFVPVNCPVSFNFSQPRLVLAVGGSMDVEVSPVTEGERSILPLDLPNGIEFALDQSLAATTRISEKTLRVEALSLGSGTLTVRDPWTQSEGALRVDVVTPKIDAVPSSTLTLDDTTPARVTLIIRDPQSNDVDPPIALPPAIIWESDALSNALQLIDTEFGGRLALWEAPAGTSSQAVKVWATSSTGVRLGELEIRIDNRAPVAYLYRIAYGLNCPDHVPREQRGYCGGIQSPTDVVTATTTTANSLGNSSSRTYLKTGASFIFEDGNYDSSTRLAIPHSPTACFRNGRWVPMRYPWSVTIPTVYDGGSCESQSIVTFSGALEIDTNGKLTSTFERNSRNTQNCAEPVYDRWRQTKTMSNMLTSTFGQNLLDGSGTYSSSETSRNDFSQTSSSGAFPSYSTWDTSRIEAAGVWPRESVVPPLHLGLHLTRTPVHSNEPLPPACLILGQ